MYFLNDKDDDAKFLNETGMTNMGDPNEITTQSKPRGLRLVLPDNFLTEDINVLPYAPFQWVEDLDQKDEEGNYLWFPVFDIEGVAIEAGESRPHKELYNGERQLFLQVFTNHISKLLFGIPCLNIEQELDDTIVSPNPEFQSLPFYNPTPTTPE
jgi:hypothetical protein